MSSVGGKIKEARLKAKMTEKQLAKKCGVAESFIVQVESGKKVINEKTAENILSKLGVKMESIIQEGAPEEKAEKPKVTKQESKPKEEFNPIQPNEQWSDALANIIKKYPIYALDTNKIVGHKDLPVLDKKVEGYKWDKLFFVKYSGDDLNELRIKKNDTIMIYMNTEIQNNKVYLVEMNNQKLVRQLKKESSKITLIKGPLDQDPISVDISKLKVVGKCVRVEFEV